MRSAAAVPGNSINKKKRAETSSGPGHSQLHTLHDIVLSTSSNKKTSIRTGTASHSNPGSERKETEMQEKEEATQQRAQCATRQGRGTGRSLQGLLPTRGGKKKSKKKNKQPLPMMIWRAASERGWFGGSLENWPAEAGIRAERAEC